MLAHAGVDASRSLDVLDAGCGTGLCGPLVAPYARRLVGVDLSEAMLARARARNVYDELVKRELTAYLRDSPGSFDVIVSADTLVYFGPLEEVAAAAANALRPGGVLVFTVEELSGAASDAGYSLSPNGRYRHSPALRRARAGGCGTAVGDRPGRAAPRGRRAGRRGWWCEEQKGSPASALGEDDALAVERQPEGPTREKNPHRTIPVQGEVARMTIRRTIARASEETRAAASCSTLWVRAPAHRRRDCRGREEGAERREDPGDLGGLASASRRPWGDRRTPLAADRRPRRRGRCRRSAWRPPAGSVRPRRGGTAEPAAEPAAAEPAAAAAAEPVGVEDVCRRAGRACRRTARGSPSRSRS